MGYGSTEKVMKGLDFVIILMQAFESRMRNAAVLVVRVKGVATEALKNIALAGVGSLIVADGESVTEEDLGAGFFYRDEDIGKNVWFFVSRFLPGWH